MPSMRDGGYEDAYKDQKINGMGHLVGEERIYLDNI